MFTRCRLSPADFQISERSPACGVTAPPRGLFLGGAMRMRLEGRRFGRLVVMHYVGDSHYAVKCDCGTHKKVRGFSMTNGATRSCGCLLREVARKQHVTHGHTRNGVRTPEHRAWAAMIQRCCNPRCQEWKNYGGRGIRVCAKWRRSFSAFFADVGARPDPHLSLDRIDNARGYSPGNVRWATSAQQQANKRSSGPVSKRPQWIGRCREMREAGATYQTIAEKIGFSIGIVWRWLQ